MVTPHVSRTLTNTDMPDLRISPVDWDEVEAEEIRLLRQMTIAESVAHLVSLYRAFGPLLEQTEPLFRAEREAYLIELQRRLRRLEEWRKERDGTP